MHPVSPRGAGFSLIETMVALAIFAILLAVGVPNLRAWLGATSATGAAQFYAEGFTQARNLALSNNARSRLVFTENAKSGQRDWQADVCFPDATDNCAQGSTRWSDLDQPAATPDTVDVATASVFRSAASLPRTAALEVTPDDDANAVYFTELGWVDTGKPAVTRFDLAPPGEDDGFPAMAVMVTLAGAVVTCRTNAADGDARRCP